MIVYTRDPVLQQEIDYQKKFLNSQEVFQGKHMCHDLGGSFFVYKEVLATGNKVAIFSERWFREIVIRNFTDVKISFSISSAHGDIECCEEKNVDTSRFFPFILYMTSGIHRPSLGYIEVFYHEGIGEPPSETCTIL